MRIGLQLLQQRPRNSKKSWIESLKPIQRRRLLTELNDVERGQLLFHWPAWVRPAQLAPAGEWSGWLVIAGRGWGKTRVGAETVRAEVEAGRAKRIGLVAETSADG